jgi:hypothetical protein
MRKILVFIAALLALTLPLPAAAQSQNAARPWLNEPMIWGVNGHPFTAYPGIDWDDQLDDVLSLGLTHYRINTRPDGSVPYLDRLLPMAQARGVTLMPLLQPEIDWERDTPEELYRRSYDLGRGMAERYRGRVKVWSLGNEMEAHAIIQPCEMRDDGTQYPCEWGPAGGVGPLEYVGARWAKVSAVLRGLSEGVAAGDPQALRAIGTAGWGHLGAFERMRADGITWDITTWHDYEGVSEEFLRVLASYGKPIWITEFNAGLDTMSADERSTMVRERVAYYRAMREHYPIAAVFVYELYDEPYWGDNFEARQGLIGLDAIIDGRWRIGAEKPSAVALREAITAPAAPRHLHGSAP